MPSDTANPFWICPVRIIDDKMTSMCNHRFSDLFRNSKGKMSYVRIATSKTDGSKYAAKMIYFDDDVKFAIREYDLMAHEKQLTHKALVRMKEAYMVRKYLIIIMDL